MKKYINSFLSNILIEGFLISLIIFNLFIFVLETNKALYATYNVSIQYFEYFSVIVFSLEYILRVISLEKLKDIFKPIMIVDLLAILPFYLCLMSISAPILCFLRFCRIFRIAKLARYKNAIINY